MIYVIVNQSHEWDEPMNARIDFISTSLEKAEEAWEKYFSMFNTLDDSKWCYSADLREYPDGYDPHGRMNNRFTILKHIDTIGE